MRVNKINFFLIILGFLLFVLTYFDEVEIGGLKFGVLWKSLLVLFFLHRIIFQSAVAWSLQFVVGMAYAIKSLIYFYHSLDYFVIDFIEVIKYLSLPLAIEFFRVSFADSALALKYLKFVAFWVLLSCVPFLFGLSPYEVKDFQSLDLYGYEGLFSFSGVFGNPHNAAVSVAAALVVIVHLMISKNIRMGLAGLLIGIGLIVLYQTYARTGWICFLVAINFYALLYLPFRSYLKYSFLGLIVLSIAFYFAFEYSDIFRMRITGTNLYEQDDSLNQLGSGRFDFWSAALNGPWSEGLPGFLVGIGLGYTKDLMEQAVGLHIFSHNGFLDAYQTSGLIGLIFFFFYCYALFFESKKASGNELSRAFLYSMYGFFIVLQIFQGGVFFWFNIFMALAVANGWSDRPNSTSLQRLKL